MKKRPRSVRRRGVAMLMVLAVLAVVLVSTAVLLQRVIEQERATRGIALKLQAQLLAESAFDRAFAKLTADANYAGETWQPAFTGLSAKEEQARVTIAVQAPDQADVFQVTVTALCPDHPIRRAQVVSRKSLRLASSSN
jgi:type II secretory pathway component PulK